MAISVLKYKGTAANDHFYLTPSRLASAAITGGAGSDTLRITTSSDFSFGRESYRSMLGLDVLDFTYATGPSTTVKLSQALLDQSDARALTIVSGASGIDLLSADAGLAGAVTIAGIGEVERADPGWRGRGRHSRQRDGQPARRRDGQRCPVRRRRHGPHHLSDRLRP
jgi:hypothetical protein